MSPTNVTPSLLLGDGAALMPAHLADTADEAVAIIRSGQRAQVPSNSVAFETLKALGADDDEAAQLLGVAMKGIAKPEVPKPYDP